MMRTYVLDANAVLDFAEAGPGRHRVGRLIEEAVEARVQVFISVLNWGEVFYYLWQKLGEEEAKRILNRLSHLPVQIVPVDLFQALKASEIKVLHKIPYVDCVAAALAEITRSVLVTSDRDFEKIGRRIQVLWLKRP